MFSRIDPVDRRRESHGSWRRGRWAIVMLLGMAAGLLLGELLRPAPAVAQSAGGAGKDVVVVAGQLAPQLYGLYVVDVAGSSICVYQWMPQRERGELKLMAARTFRFDRMLEEYNSVPSPREIKAIVEQSGRLAPPGP